MTTRGLALVIASALFTVVANLMMRAGVLKAGGLTLDRSTGKQMLALALEPLFMTGLVFYALAAIVWFHVLSVENLSTSYPLLVSMTFVLVTAGAMIFFQETVSAGKLTGIGLCLLGVVVIARA